MTPLRILATIAAFAAATAYAAPKVEARGLRLGLGIGLLGAAAIVASRAHEQRRFDEMHHRANYMAARRAALARQTQIARARAEERAAARAEAAALKIEKHRAAQRLATALASRQAAAREPAARLPVAAAASPVATAPSPVAATPVIVATPAAPVIAEPARAPESLASSAARKDNSGELCQRFLPTAGVTIAVPCAQ